MIEKTLDLFADYFQFYVQDEKSDGIGGDSWTNAAHDARLALEDGAFAVTTARNMDVPVKIIITDGPPDLDLSLWDHAVECSINVSSGKLVVAGCTEYFPDAERISVENGCYEVRVLYANLESLSEDGLDGDDSYHIELWQGQAKPLQVLKQHHTLHN